MKNTVIVADRYALMRDGITRKIEESKQLQLVGECETASEVVAACMRAKPDLLLLDADLDGADGACLLERVCQASPTTKIVIMTMDNSMVTIIGMLTRGAVGFVPKQAAARDFIYALCGAVGGFGTLPVGALNEIVAAQPGFNKNGNIFGLSGREVEVLQCVVQKTPNQNIARRLDISIRTVETHRANIFKKTKCRDLNTLKDILAMIPDDESIEPGNQTRTQAATQR
ncbi:response regulator transcription factor [Yoonia sp. SS1-5]|uniref:Response regulator n=1 Tax=Yoonia rhodophyticola TaxID=3137370 RepID=A0AAN0MCT4_9RHOB